MGNIIEWLREVVVNLFSAINIQHELVTSHIYGPWA